MTRIIAGEWRGHPLPTLKTGTVRPTTDRARTILFDTLRDVHDMDVLDLFSGTGALGFEALSRGARSVISVDRDSNYIHAQKNWMEDRGKSFKTYTGDVHRVLKRVTQHFDLIFADPPYAESLGSELVTLIEEHANKNALFIYESSKREDKFMQSDVFELIKEKVVAETKIQIYKAH